MKIDLIQEMAEPTPEEIEIATKQFISFSIRRDRVVQRLVEGMKAIGPDNLAVIKVSDELLKAMPPLFMSGKFMGLQVLQDPAAVGLTAEVLTKLEVEQQAQALREITEENKLTGEQEGERAAGEDQCAICGKPKPPGNTTICGKSECQEEMAEISREEDG